MANVYNFSSTIIPAVIVGSTTLILDLTNNVSIRDKLLYIDIVLNILSFLSSRYIVLNFSDFFSTDVLFQYYLDIITEPFLNGLILGTIYKYGFQSVSITRFKDDFYNKNHIVINNYPFTFKNGMTKGFLADIIANYLYNPLVKVS